MNVKVENIEKNKVKLTIEVDAATFEAGLSKAAAKNAKKYNVPGFRAGKAPRAVIERYYGKTVFFEDAINEVCPEIYDAAVDQEGIVPVERPDIDIEKIGVGENFVFTATVTVKPEVVLGQYKAVEVKKAETLVTEVEVEAELEKVAKKNSRQVTVEDRAVENNDTAVIDFEGFVDGIAFEGGKGENYSLLIGSGTFIPGFEEQIIGATIGNEIDVNVSFPEQYHSAELAGKPAVFKVTVKEIKRTDMPVIDDEFAKDVSEFDTLEEYKSSLREQLVKSAQERAKNQEEEETVEKVVANATIELPEVMIETRVDSLIRDFDMRLRYQGMDLKNYLEMMGMDEAAFRGQFRTRAENEVRTQLVLEKISVVENIEVSDAEVEEEVVRFATQYRQEVDTFKASLREEDFGFMRDTVKVRKTVEFLVASAKIA